MYVFNYILYICLQSVLNGFTLFSLVYIKVTQHLLKINCLLKMYSFFAIFVTSINIISVFFFLFLRKSQSILLRTLAQGKTEQREPKPKYTRSRLFVYVDLKGYLSLGYFFSRSLSSFIVLWQQL